MIRIGWVIASVLLVEACASSEGAVEPARSAASPSAAEPAGPSAEPTEHALPRKPRPPVEVDESLVNHRARGAIVVLGSSTAAGLGPSSYQNTWVSRYRAYLAKEFPKFKLTNLAVSGYTTYHVQATDFVPPLGRPNPDPAKNITAALALSPSAIIVNLPSNDEAKGYSLDEQMANFERLYELAASSGVPVWITTTQPRNFEVPLQLTGLVKARDALESAFENHSIDFWTNIAMPDATIRPEWDSGDGVHLNDAAHAVLTERVIACKIPELVASRARK